MGSIAIDDASHTVSQEYPDLPQFSGFMKPCRFEGEVQNLEIQGRIPSEINGTFYRVMPDPQFSPFVKNDPWFNGDGNIGAFQIKAGRVHFKQKFVRTEKFVRERKAQRALAGKYRNKYTDLVEFAVRTTANTNIVAFNGKLLALKEDARPYAMDPKTLDTIGLETFNGQLPGLTFTAHPKFDPKTGEMVCFGYEAKGDGTPDICYYTISADGNVTEVVWLTAPVVAMIHDFSITDNWVIFPLIPLTCDIERLKKGGEHWQWTPDIPAFFGVIRRRGAQGSDVKWFRAPNCFPGHVSNGFETPDGKIHVDLSISSENVFYWWPDEKGQAPNPQEIKSTFNRITIDPRATVLDLPPALELQSDNTEFYRIDDRFCSQPYTQSFFVLMDPLAGTDFATVMSVAGGGFPPYNTLAHLDFKTGKLEKYFPGPTHFVQEPIFIPRSSAAIEGDGFLVALVNNYSTMSSELHILDTRDFESVQAIVKLPVRLRHGLHGNWVDAQELSFAD